MDYHLSKTIVSILIHPSTKVANGSAMLGNARTMTPLAYKYVSFGRMPVAAIAAIFEQRSPVPIVAYFNLVKLFSWEIWFFLFVFD